MLTKAGGFRPGLGKSVPGSRIQWTRWTPQPADLDPVPQDALRTRILMLADVQEKTEAMLKGTGPCFSFDCKPGGQGRHFLHCHIPR